MLESLGFQNFDWQQIFTSLVQLTIAYALAFPIGWDRERGTRSAGLRTFPLVAMAACGFMLTGISALQGDEAYGRVMYGIITGIGFIGGGAILKSKGNVLGTATAASLWNTGAIGIAVAWQVYEIALVLSLLNFATLRLMGPVKGMFKEGEAKIEQDRE